MNNKEEEVLASLKEAISEARGVLKDFKYERKQLQELHDKAVGEVKEIVDQQIGDQVKAGLEEYKDTLAKAIDAATDRVYKRFDTLADIMMGTDDPHKEPLEVLVRRWKTRRD